MNLDNNEQYIRDQLYRERIEVDTGSLWETIQPEIRKKKKRRFAFLWWFAGAAASLGLLILAGVTPLHPKGGNGLETIDVYSPLPPEVVSSVKNCFPSPPSLLTLAPQLKLLQHTVSDGAKEEHPPTDSQGVMRGWGSPLGGFRGARKGKLNSPAPMPPEGGSGLETIDVYSPLISKEEPGMTPLPPKGRDDPEVKSAHPTIPLLQGAWGSPTFKKKKNNSLGFSISAQFGIAKTFSRVSSRNDENQDYARQWAAANHPLEAVSVEISPEIRHRSGLYLRSGIGYTRIANRTKVDRQTVETDSIPGSLLAVHLHSSGDTSFITGTATRRRTTFYKARLHTYSHLLDIPVIAGYEWRKPPFSFSVEGGIYANIIMKSNGVWYGEGGILERFTVKNDHHFKRNVGLSYYSAIKFGWQATPRFQVYVQPYWRYFPGSFTRDGEAVELKYQAVGLNVGTRWRF